MDPRDMMPPVPPTHLPPQFPNEPSRAVPHPQGRPQDPMAGGAWPTGQPINDDSFTNRMENLHLDGHPTGKSKVIVEQNNPPKYRSPLDSNSYRPLYRGWIISRKELDNGQKPDWTHVHRKPMLLSPATLENKVKDGKRRMPAVDQYLALGRLQRDRVDDLIREHERQDPRFQWTCEYAKVKGQDVRRKGDLRGSIKIVELNIVLMRRLRPQPLTKSATSSSSFTRSPFNNVGNGFLNPESKGNPELAGMSAQFGQGPPQFPQSMAAAGQHAQGQHIQGQHAQGQHAQGQHAQGQHAQGQHAQGQHAQGQHAQGQHAQGQHPFNKPGQDYMMMGAIPPQQNAQYAGGGQPTMVPNHTGPKGPAGIEILRGGTPFYPRGATGHTPAQAAGNPNMPFAMFPDEFAKKSRKPHANMAATKIYHQDHHHSKSPKMPPAPEPFLDSSSEDDDDSMRFREDEESSATEDMPEEKFEKFEKAWYPRGSLHPQRRNSKQRKDELPYRVHYRKQPQKVNEGDRHRYSTSFVDVIPGSSLRPRREHGKTSQYDFTQRARPRVIHDDLSLHDPIPDIAYLDEKLREQKREREYDRQREQQRAVQELIFRNRLQKEAKETLWRHEQLQEMEESLRRRELALAYRVREHEARILNRGLTFREPPPFGHELDYLVRDDLSLRY